MSASVCATLTLKWIRDWCYGGDRICRREHERHILRAPMWVRVWAEDHYICHTSDSMSTLVCNESNVRTKRIDIYLFRSIERWVFYFFVGITKKHTTLMNTNICSLQSFRWMSAQIVVVEERNNKYHFESFIADSVLFLRRNLYPLRKISSNIQNIHNL